MDSLHSIIQPFPSLNSHKNYDKVISCSQYQLRSNRKIQGSIRKKSSSRSLGSAVDESLSPQFLYVLGVYGHLVPGSFRSENKEFFRSLAG